MSEIIAAQHLLRQGYFGALSTHAKILPGYPFGSVVPYCLDAQGLPIILISNIAQHYHNIQLLPQVSLLVLEHGVEDVQTTGRLTWIADAQPIAIDDVDSQQRYYRFFPASRDYHKTHGFYFYRLVPMRIRYIGGFGKIYWLEPSDLLLSNPFSAQEELSILEHMNHDHRAALQRYAAQAQLDVNNDSPTLIGVDTYGFYLRLGTRPYYFLFAHPVNSLQDVRHAFIELLRS